MQPAKALSTEPTFPPLCPLNSSRALPADNAGTQNYRTVFHQSEDHDFPKAHRPRRASTVHKDRTVLFPAPRHSSSLKDNDSSRIPPPRYARLSGTLESATPQLRWLASSAALTQLVFSGTIGPAVAMLAFALPTRIQTPRRKLPFAT
jgi:hypothetical protein